MLPEMASHLERLGPREFDDWCEWLPIDGTQAVPYTTNQMLVDDP